MLCFDRSKHQVFKVKANLEHSSNKAFMGINKIH